MRKSEGPAEWHQHVWGKLQDRVSPEQKDAQQEGSTLKAAVEKQQISTGNMFGFTLMHCVCGQKHTGMLCALSSLLLLHIVKFEERESCASIR